MCSSYTTQVPRRVEKSGGGGARTEEKFCSDYTYDKVFSFVIMSTSATAKFNFNRTASLTMFTRTQIFQNIFL